jgi:hypothetical protein
MKPIGKALLELRSTLFSIGLFNSLVDSMIILLFSLLAALLLGLSWTWALIPFFIYFVFHGRKVLKALGYADVENRVPQLREALRTAADSVETENEVVRALHTEVLGKMQLIQTSAFIGFGKVTRQLVVIALLCFAIISVSALNIKFIDGTALLNGAGLSGISGGLFGAHNNQTLFGKLSKQEDSRAKLLKEVTLIDESSLYGNSSVVELGTDELNLEINPEASGVKIGDVRPPDSKKFTDQPTATDIQASSDKTFSEDIPKEYQGIVRNYFKNIPK